MRLDAGTWAGEISGAWTWIAAGVVALVAAWAGWTFNRLVRRRNGVSEAWATVDVELTRRHDLVPALVELVRGYADFEAGVLTRVTDARSRAVAAVDAVSETALSDAVRTLFAVAEAYPELQVSAWFHDLQEELALTEDRIAYARAVYNAWVTEYETARLSFPSSVVARLLHFDRREYFEADMASRGDVAVSLSGLAGG